jgi:hypothetical protein
VFYTSLMRKETKCCNVCFTNVQVDRNRTALGCLNAGRMLAVSPKHIEFTEVYN